MLRRSPVVQQVASGFYDPDPEAFASREEYAQAVLRMDERFRADVLRELGVSRSPIVDEVWRACVAIADGDRLGTLRCMGKMKSVLVRVDALARERDAAG
ncbi:MAG: hypothetical protein D6701_06430 [Gemmatimonadetes bacterium]|nr:MAG: hypothetical protein D6701_06430 [Gemmatimonadota bacterium]